MVGQARGFDAMNIVEDAKAIALEDVLGDLLESRNGVNIDAAWIEQTIRHLLLARDEPRQFLLHCWAMPGSKLDAWQKMEGPRDP